MGVLLEVTVTQVRDVPPALEGGADRLLLVAPGEHAALSPAPVEVSAVVREAEVPVRVMLRLSEGVSTTGGEFTRLVALAEEYLALGAEGVCYGFLTADNAIDVDTCRALAERLVERVGATVPWTFHRAFDDTLEVRRAWRAVADLPGLDSVRSAGSPRGLGAGYEDLLALAEHDPVIAGLVMPGGGLVAEQVPWFLRAGVDKFHLGPQVRPGGSYKAYVDAGHLRSWRRLVDDVR